MEHDQHGRRRSVRIIEKTLKIEVNTEKTTVASTPKQNGCQQSAPVHQRAPKKRANTGKRNPPKRTQKPRANTPRRTPKRTATKKTTANTAKRDCPKGAQGVANTEKQLNQEENQHKQIRPSTETQKKWEAQTPERSSLSPEPQSNKRRQEQNPAVPDSHIEQELLSESPQTEGDAAVHHWIENGGWPIEMAHPTPHKQLSALRLSSRPPTASNPPTTTVTTQTKVAGPKPYATNAGREYLESKSSFLDDDGKGPAQDDKELCRELSESDCILPRGTVFENEYRDYLAKHLLEGNENLITRIISQFVVPSAELEFYSGRLISKPRLVESANEPWMWSTSLDEAPSARRSSGTKEPNRSLPVPQPDYAVGFSRHEFTDEQNRKLEPILGEIDEISVCKGVKNMRFPFLACELKSTAGRLRDAHCQNTHTLTRCLRGVVELFKLSGRERELHRKILGFSFCHDHKGVEIYAHYPVFEPTGKIEYHRQEVGMWSFISVEERWKSYRFAMGIYHNWAPSHFKLLCSAIDSIPDAARDGTPRQSVVRSESPTNQDFAGSQDSFSEERKRAKLAAKKRDRPSDDRNSQFQAPSKRIRG
ncbi:hypothetical protein ASPBRDRAFT_176189 [Aspergillus brasiliensis CBS 101740]|uniref:DUF7924 domain-containing protein n=1 Tax=Aspergillus brasiliensis (strain CBS 101740 / IMI 381727 / IBT 21946) TaxID=767769 RepID=A0A1L9UM10_ASPBC|nr:hypothetical protein ASPBRDRAFT_176189 [Aspergillus brasiliensis CBS 101740]